MRHRTLHHWFCRLLLFLPSSIKTVTDYAMTKVRDVGTFLLPTRSESTACIANRSLLNNPCTTNTLVFHDYQKFTTSTRILGATPEP